MTAFKETNINCPNVYATFFVEDAVECISAWNKVNWKPNRNAYLKKLYAERPSYVKFDKSQVRALVIATRVFQPYLATDIDILFSNITKYKPGLNSDYCYILKQADKINIDRFDNFFIFVAAIGGLCTKLWISGKHRSLVPTVVDATQFCLQKLVPGQLGSAFVKIRKFASSFLQFYDNQELATGVSDDSYCSSLSSVSHKSHRNVIVPYDDPCNAPSSLSDISNLIATLPCGTSDCNEPSFEPLPLKATDPYNTLNNSVQSSTSNNSSFNVTVPDRFSYNTAAASTSSTSPFSTTLPSEISYYNTKLPNNLNQKAIPLSSDFVYCANSSLPDDSNLNVAVSNGASCYDATSSTFSCPNAIMSRETSFYNTALPNNFHTKATPPSDVLHHSAHSSVSDISHLNVTVSSGSCYGTTLCTPSDVNETVPGETSYFNADSSIYHTPNVKTLLSYGNSYCSA